MTAQPRAYPSNELLLQYMRDGWILSRRWKRRGKADVYYCLWARERKEIEVQGGSVMALLHKKVIEVKKYYNNVECDFGVVS